MVIVIGFMTLVECRALGGNLVTLHSNVEIV